MTDLEKYNQIFIKLFEVSEADLVSLKYEDIDAWDSVGQMELIAEIEDTFGICFEMDDMLDFTSYENGKVILKKYEIEL